MTVNDLDKVIRRVPDFPKPGILFYDITSVFTNPEAFNFCIEKMVSIYKDCDFDGICAIESRGFLVASPFANIVKKPLILIRKKGKLPCETYSCSYALEYGTAEIEVHKSDVQAGKKYLVVDDLIATGGTMSATKKMLEMAGASVCDFFGIIGLPELNYQKVLEPVKVTTLIQFTGK